MPREWEANVRTTDKAVDLLWHGLAPNTHQVYRAGQATYARFASSQGFKPFPSNLKHSLKSLPLPPKKRRWRQSNHTSVTSEATTSIKATRKYGNRSKRERLEITSEILQAVRITIRYTHEMIS